MKYARAHVKRFWIFQNKRALGISFLAFSIVFSVGIVFTAILDQFFIVNPANLFLAWILLILIASAVLVTSLSSAHTSIASVMNKAERAEHSKHVGRFLIVMTIGIVLFMLPIALIPLAASLTMLFSIGGILMVLYLTTSIIFKHRYHEVAVASLLVWLSFLLALVSIGPQYYLNPPFFEYFSFLIASVVVIVVFAMMGLIMLTSSANEFISEFKQVYKIK